MSIEKDVAPLKKQGNSAAQKKLSTMSVQVINNNEIDIWELQNQKVQNNWNPDNCCLCGKPVGRNAKTIHYLTSGNITSLKEEEVDNSQGHFPIGNECAKKLPPEFIFD